MESNKYLQSKRIYQKIYDSYKAIPQDRSKLKIRVGIVGEIYMKYSPLGNSHLEDFLRENDFEPVLSGVMDFGLYCLMNSIIDYEYYHRLPKIQPWLHLGKKFVVSKQMQFAKMVKKDAIYLVPDNFDEMFEEGKKFINKGVKMGEGWLLTSEVVALINSGVNNIIMAQPFGCLPNHIVAKGMVKKIKDKYPQANLVAIDFDPSASKVNQENRIRLMMANARLSRENDAS